MKNKPVFWLFILILAGVASFFLWQLFRPVNLPDVNMSAFGSDTVRARVTEIIEEGEIDLVGTLQRYQVARVELLEGEYQGIVMEMDYGRRGVLSNVVYLAGRRYGSGDDRCPPGWHPDRLFCGF